MTTRRSFIVGLGAAAAGSAVSYRRLAAALESPLTSRISVLTDEISQDLGHAYEVRRTSASSISGVSKTQRRIARRSTTACARRPSRPARRASR